jgi:murein L,D-transpeptidase YcbB/YkuD
MGTKTAYSRRYLIGGIALCAAALGVYGIATQYPPLGPVMATIAPQRYVDSLADGEIPARGRYVLVDAASARLFMMENGRVVDSMKVIVGKPAAATPALKSVLYYATLNPYWNVPPDLAQKLIAPRVLKDGDTYLNERGYEVVTSFADPQRLPADDVDWAKVASGETTVKIRQRPGPANSMGQIKFNLADANGFFLHDTPNKEPFTKADRNISNGCVRLEDAPRFARWLLGNDPPLASAPPEKNVVIPGAMPITIAYLDSRAQMQVAGLQ